MILKSLLVFICLFISALAVQAESEGILNKLLAPGPLILGHKNLEGKDCLKCHDAGKGISDAKCMECHKEIKWYVENKRGFHGLNDQSCMKCHADHKGRNFDSVLVDETKFDHFKMTGYTLDGKHADLKCVECHTEKRTKKPIRPLDTRWFGQQATCISCHKKDDIHFFKNTGYAKKDCNACHANTSWKTDIRFDHNKDTRYELVGKHAKLECNDCHQPNKKIKVFNYKWPQLEKKQCLSCHADFHKQNLSPRFQNGKCTQCHTQDEWKIPQFKHEVTRFKLRGEHAEIKCTDCHRPKGFVKGQRVPEQFQIKNLNFTGLKQACLSCHEDYHRFGSFRSQKMGDLNQCLKCHTEKDWKQTHTFDHNISTRYKIDGEHVDLKCATCHLPNAKNLKTNPKKLYLVKVPTYSWPQLETKTCENCHVSPHKKTFSLKMQEQKCTQCHVTEGWNVDKASSNFDHSKTRFALTGAHKTTKCVDCHGPVKKQIFKFKNEDQKFCIDCHNNIHVGQFSPKFSGQACFQCHSTSTFKELRHFEHSKTSFALKGEHQEVDCIECHKPTNDRIKLKWPNFRSKNHSEIKTFNRGKYLFPEVKTKSCSTCHDDYHQGQLSKNCAECHTEKSWKSLQFNHNTQSRFKLVDKHEKVKCSECHKPTDDLVEYKNETRFVIKYKPIKTDCINCHTDIHKGQLSKNCTECHSEKGWKPANFDHNIQSKYALKGKHIDVDCVKCHKATGEKVQVKNSFVTVFKYKPLSTACIDCHKDPHRGSFGSACAECHTEKSWKLTKDFHKNFTLTGVHFSLECAECHKDGRKLSGMSQQCLACHQKDDVHNGTLPNCKTCHTQQFWEASQFRHSLTKFPLRGSHRTLDCAECHTAGVYQGLSSSCVSCHRADFDANPTAHQSQPNNTNCIQCHRNTFTFSRPN